MSIKATYTRQDGKEVSGTKDSASVTSENKDESTDEFYILSETVSTEELEQIIRKIIDMFQ